MIVELEMRYFRHSFTFFFCLDVNISFDDDDVVVVVVVFVMKVVISSNTALAGHVRVDDKAIIGGQCGIKQFIHIGTSSMVGGVSKVVSVSAVLQEQHQKNK